MRDAPFSVGVLTRMILRFQNVALRRLASPTGSPSVPADKGYLSTSSQRMIRHGRDARELGLFAPQAVTWPPAKTLCKVVLPPSRDLGFPTLSSKTGVSLMAGASLSFDHVCAISNVGCTTNMGAGSWWIWKPTTLLISSVLPICAAVIRTIFSMLGSLTLSIIPR